MNVSCPECRTVYRVDPAKVVGTNVRARCSTCGAVIAVSEHLQWGDDFPDTRLAPPAPREGARASLGTPPAPRPVVAASTPPVAAAAALPGGIAAARSAVAAPAAAAPIPARPASPSPTVVPPVPALATEPAAGSRVPPFVPRRASPAGPSFGAPSFPASTLRPPTPAFVPTMTNPSAFGAPLAPVAPPRAPAAAPAPVPAAAEPIVPPRASVSAPADALPAMRSPGVSAPPPPEVSTAARPAPPPPAAAPVARPGAAPTAARKPINPFLSNDPNQKARRLARALVSDMIAYHPGKRDEGARQGTLKQLFREEIKKSYEEYVEQVGREFAEATSHFQDALNEILAGGKRLF